MSKYTDAEIAAEHGRRLRGKQTHIPNPPKLRPCPRCGIMFGARALRVHAPLCRRLHLEPAPAQAQ